MSDLSTFDTIANKYITRQDSFARVEVGDVKQPGEFFPQAKIMRWDNECNFSARLDPKVHYEPSPVISLAGDKVLWTGKKIGAHFYQVGAGLEGDSFEFEVICNERPPGGQIQMTLQTKGLDFFYQPFLKNVNPDGSYWEDNGHGGQRSCPANVCGSYAVYHKTMAGDYSALGGQNYLAGKAFHIYRPRLEDAVGQWTWGELSIDEKTGLLIVSAPEKFWAQAVYPVRHAAGLTFGYTSLGALLDYGEYYYFIGSPASNVASNGTLSNITLAIYCATSNKHIKAALYPDNGGSPSKPSGNMIANSYTGEITITRTTKPVNPADWTVCPTGAASIISGTKYWITFAVDTGSIYICYDDVANKNCYAYFSYSDFPPASAPVTNINADLFSAYATYTPAATDVSLALTSLSALTEAVNVGMNPASIGFSAGSALGDGAIGAFPGAAAFPVVSGLSQNSQQAMLSAVVLAVSSAFGLSSDQAMQVAVSLASISSILSGSDATLGGEIALPSASSILAARDALLAGSVVLPGTSGMDQSSIQDVQMAIALAVTSSLDISPDQAIQLAGALVAITSFNTDITQSSLAAVALSISTVLGISSDQAMQMVVALAESTSMGFSTTMVAQATLNLSLISSILVNYGNSFSSSVALSVVAALSLQTGQDFLSAMALNVVALLTPSSQTTIAASELLSAQATLGVAPTIIMQGGLNLAAVTALQIGGGFQWVATLSMEAQAVLGFEGGYDVLAQIFLGATSEIIFSLPALVIIRGGFKILVVCSAPELHAAVGGPELYAKVSDN